MATTTLPDTEIIETKTAETKPVQAKAATTKYVYFFGGGNLHIGGDGLQAFQLRRMGIPGSVADLALQFAVPGSVN